MSKDENTRKIIVVTFLVVALMAKTSFCQLGAIRDFIQLNLAGLPVIHDKVTWDFDPDISAKRSKFWQKNNGVKGDKLIERLGLGMDGYEEERLEKQQIRDEGHLGGLNYFRP